MEILGSLLIYCKWVSDNHLAEFSSFWLTLDFNLSIQFLNWLYMPVSEKNISQLVYPEGLEPSRPCGHSDLNAACLPFHHGYIKSVCRSRNWSGNLSYSILTLWPQGKRSLEEPLSHLHIFRRQGILVSPLQRLAFSAYNAKHRPPICWCSKWDLNPHATNGRGFWDLRVYHSTIRAYRGIYSSFSINIIIYFFIFFK